MKKIILIMAIILMTMPVVNVKASTLQTNNETINTYVKSLYPNAKAIELPSDDYVLMYDSNGIIIIIWSDSEILYDNSGATSYKQFYSKAGDMVKYYVFNAQNPITPVYLTHQQQTIPDSTGISDDVIGKRMVYANHDILDTLSGDVFFYQLRSPMIQQMKTIPLTGTLIQVVSLLPLLMPLTVLFLGLRKGIQLLTQVLHQA